MTVIESRDQLRLISRSLGITSLIGRVPGYRFALPELSEATNREASERMENYHRECGCFAGGVALGIAALSVLIVFLTGERSLTDLRWGDIPLLVGLMLASTLVGKMLGVAWARARAIQLLRHLAREGVVQEG